MICKCGSRFVPTATRPTKINPNAWVRWVRLLRSRDDKGVGDTVKRILATFGGERFKAFATRVGIPCKCAERQAEWNKLWPY